jgi:hypothetical protein
MWHLPFFPIDIAESSSAHSLKMLLSITNLLAHVWSMECAQNDSRFGLPHLRRSSSHESRDRHVPLFPGRGMGAPSGPDTQGEVECVVL